MNGLSAWIFDGTNDCLELDEYLLDQPFTMFVIWKPVAVTGWPSILAGTAAASVGLGLDNSNPGLVSASKVGTSTSTAADTSVTTGSWGLTVYRSGGVENTTRAGRSLSIHVRQNGVTGAGIALPGLTNATAGRIGGDSGPTRLSAEIAELRGALYDEKHGITATLRNDQIEAQATRITELESALEVLRDRVQDEYDRIYISGVLAK